MGAQRRLLGVIFVTTMAAFLTGLNARLALVGFPVIARELGAGIDGALWIVQGFMVGSTIVQLVVGRLADLYGRVKLFNLGLAVFTAAALISGLSTNWTMLAAARVVQGVGGAFLMTLSITILTDNVPQNALGTWLGVNQVAWRIGALVGLTLSGLIVDALGWRWLYVIYVPVGFFAYLWSSRVLREVYSSPGKPCLDVIGFATFTVSMSALLVYLTMLLRGLFKPLLLVASLATLVAFVLAEKRGACRTLDFGVFRNWQFTGGVIAQLLYSVGFGSSLTLLVVLLEVSMCLSATATGLSLIPFELSFLVAGILGGRLSDKLGFTAPATAGLLLSTAGLYALSRVSTLGTPITAILLFSSLLGLGTGLFVAPNTGSIMAAVNPDERGVASAIRSLALNVGFVLSLNIAFLVLASHIPHYEVTNIVLLGEAIEASAGVKLLEALSKSFRVQALLMAAAIPFTVSRFRKAGRCSASNWV